MFVRAFFVTCLFGAAFAASRSFPEIGVLNSYSTEVQLSLVKEEATVYVKEYHDNLNKRGSVSIYFQDSLQSVYYDNDTNEVLDVNSTHCKATEVDISDYTYTPLYHGWLSTDPLVIGPSAMLSYALKYKDKIVYVGNETARDIPCDKYELTVRNKVDNLRIQYYFAPEDWTTPYMYKKFTPIRIRVVGMSSRYSSGESVDVDQISDFAYFKASIDDLNNLQPPIGIGCRFRKKSDTFPDVPEVFRFSAEMVDVLQIEKHDDIEVQFERVFYDYPERLARVDRYTKAKGFKSALYDFRGGAAHYRLNDGSCQVSTLRDTELLVYDLGVSGRMAKPKELLLLNGDFYSMGKREIRGIKCDAYESVIYDAYIFDKHFHKFVLTVYFIESITRVGVDGVVESQIPVYMVGNGWSTPTNRTFSLQYNMFGFTDVIFPPMYLSFGLERCYSKSESKTYFVVILEVPKKDATLMEGQDDLIIMELRNVLATHAKVPEHRIPFLKADYKSTGVYVSGVLLERPPALLQFFLYDSGPTTTTDKFYKLMPEAETLEECAYTCIDFGGYPCKGFYMCGRNCYLRSTDPFLDEAGQKEIELGVCDEYLRTVRESRTFGESYLDAALENLENAILNETVKITFLIPHGEETVIVKDIVVGDGPYTGVDTGDKPFEIASEWRKLDAGLATTQVPFYAQTLTDCYKRCKEAGGACSSFSFCPDSTKDDKECLISSELVIKDETPDSTFKPDNHCNVYRPKYLDFFEPYPGRVSLLRADKSVRGVTSSQQCAENCRREKEFVCRGFEYCRSLKTCNLHKKHILDFEPGSTVASDDNTCVHYAARFVADYMDLGRVLVDDTSDVRFDTTLDECARICSEELKEDCKSFNFCPSVNYGQTSCALSKKLLRDDGVTTTEKGKCQHYEKRDVVHDWDKTGGKSLSTTGYTKKGFTGLAIGMLALGLIIGALAFVGYSVIRSRSSGEGMAVRFMKNET